ncbi:Protein of unknown function [Thermobacillus xylanilyticus]|uniref:Uncharacterized protein n=1 Tax=Thermobacillus xylanilyticus TaxID=76633 RepID=A0ABN7S5G1_THEXY|nr:Protein of unknown function [Thermobacillus xylanilyticus]
MRGMLHGDRHHRGRKKR